MVKCKNCNEEKPIELNGLCDDCYQLQLMDYAVSLGKNVKVTYDGDKFYD